MASSKYVVLPSLLSNSQIDSLFDSVKSKYEDKLQQFQLKSNGLNVVVVPASSPTNTVHAQVVYHVGSWHEGLGETGSTHLLEHLMFKNGSSGSNIFDVLENSGAIINATTSMDRTNFYVTVQKSYLDVWMQLEAQRMATPPFEEARDKTEKKVVLDELRIGKDRLFSKLMSNIQHTAFDRSGYDHDTGGFLKDVASVSFENLYNFHRDFYGPNNATVVIVGPVHAKEVLNMVEKHFHSVARREVRNIEREETKQLGARSTAINVQMPASVACLSYKNCPGTNPDSVTTAVIAELLNFPNSGVLFNLKEKGYVQSAYVMNNRCKFSHLFQIALGLQSVQPQFTMKILQIVNGVLNSFRKGEISEEMLSIAKTKLMNSWKAEANGVQKLGAAMTEAIAMGDPTDIWKRMEHLQKVTTTDIQRVSNYLFDETRSTLGIVKPMTEQPTILNELTFFQEEVKGRAAITLKNFKEARNDAIDTSVYQTDFGKLQLVKSVASDRMEIVFTSELDAKKTPAGLAARLTSKILKEGLPLVGPPSQSHGFIQRQQQDIMQDFFDIYMTENDMNFNIEATKNHLHWTVSVAKEKNLDDIFSKLIVALKNVQVNTDVFNIKKFSVGGEIMSIKQNASKLAESHLTRLLFDENDVNFTTPATELVENLQKVTVNDVDNFYQHFVNNLQPVYVTAVVPPETKEIDIANAINKLHFNLSKEQEKDFEMKMAPSVQKTAVAQNKPLVVNLPSKLDVVIGMGIRFPVTRNDREFTALRILSNVLGGGMNSLLNNKLRKEMGLTYGCYSALKGGNHGADSWLHVTGTFEKQHMDKAMKELKHITNNFFKENCDKQDFEKKRKHFMNQLNIIIDNPEALLKLSHRNLLNGSKRTVQEIAKLAGEITYEEAMDTREMYLEGAKPQIVIVGNFN